MITGYPRSCRHKSKSKLLNFKRFSGVAVHAWTRELAWRHQSPRAAPVRAFYKLKGTDFVWPDTTSTDTM
jgi:hypothetical protein